VSDRERVLGEPQVYGAKLGRVGPDHHQRTPTTAKDELCRGSQASAEIAGVLREQANAPGN
jgi:hypothetical protein